MASIPLASRQRWDICKSDGISQIAGTALKGILWGKEARTRLRAYLVVKYYTLHVTTTITMHYLEQREGKATHPISYVRVCIPSMISTL